MAQGILAGWAIEMAADGRTAEDIAETLTERAKDIAHLPDPRHARLPEEGWPDQRGPGGDRDAPVGQADHRGQGRRGRDRRSRADPWQGPRAHDRARRCSGRSSGCRSCTRSSPDVEAFREAMLRTGARPRSGRRSRSRSSGRRSGRTSARAASASCCSTSRAASPTRTRCIAARLRQPCRPVPSGRRPRGPRLYSGPHMSRASHLRRPDRRGPFGIATAARRPVGSSGRRPTPTRRPGTVARHGGLSFHDHGARRCAHQRVGSRPAAVRPGGRSPRPRPGHAPRPARATARVHRPLPGPHGRRVGQGLHRLSRPAQPGPRPGQGRHPLPPGRDASTRSRPSRCG